MSIQPFIGRPALLGPNPFLLSSTGISENGSTLNATNAACVFIGRVRTSDGGSHTIDTTGSSAIGWRSGAITFSDAGSTFKVGIGSVDSGSGPPARAANVSDVITFDVNSSLTGGSTLPANSSISTVPSAGSKTIANGDLVAAAFQLTARGGSDAINVNWLSNSAGGPSKRPAVTFFNGVSSYSRASGTPNVVITFNDGSLGWLEGGDVYNSVTTRAFNIGSSPNEYGMLYQFPFSIRASGAYGVIGQSSGTADCDIVLYSDPLGTPVAQRTFSMDANVTALAGNYFFSESFASTYDVPANTPIGIIFKPTSATSISAFLKTLANASHRVAEAGGVNSYGISRSGGSGAFANTNSNLDLYHIGLLAAGFDGGGGGSFGVIGG